MKVTLYKENMKGSRQRLLCEMMLFFLLKALKKLHKEKYSVFQENRQEVEIGCRTFIYLGSDSDRTLQETERKVSMRYFSNTSNSMPAVCVFVLGFFVCLICFGQGQMYLNIAFKTTGLTEVLYSQQCCCCILICSQKYVDEAFS